MHNNVQFELWTYLSWRQRWIWNSAFIHSDGSWIEKMIKLLTGLSSNLKKYMNCLFVASKWIGSEPVRFHSWMAGFFTELWKQQCHWGKCGLRTNTHVRTHTQNVFSTRALHFLARIILMCLEYCFSKIKDYVCQGGPGEYSPHLATGLVAEGNQTTW